MKFDDKSHLVQEIITYGAKGRIRRAIFEDSPPQRSGVLIPR